MNYLTSYLIITLQQISQAISGTLQPDSLILKICTLEYSHFRFHTTPPVIVRIGITSWPVCPFLTGSMHCSQLCPSLRPGAQPRLKSWGVQGLGSNTGTLAPRAWPQAGLGAGGGCPSRCGSPGGSSPGNFFENSDAKSCMLMTTTLIDGLPRTCISQQTTSMSRAKSDAKFQLFSAVAPPVVRTKKQPPLPLFSSKLHTQ